VSPYYERYPVHERKSALYSALRREPIPQDVSLTGELGIQGRVRPVGGIPEKIFAARMAGIRRVVVPKENLKDVPAGLSGMEIVAAGDVFEALAALDVNAPAPNAPTAPAPTSPA
jgi:ATP-dependent Lon protease